MAGSIRSLVRSIVPNSDPQVSLLRIYPDWTESLPIIAWDVHILAIIPDGRKHPIDHVEVSPISRGRAYDYDHSWDSVQEAVDACQAILRKEQA